MASKLAQVAAQSTGITRSPVRDFYLEVCRCLPFIQRLHRLEEVVSLRQLRAVVKDKFNQFKSAKDPRVVDMLIFKGREELECYLMMHKQRHHAITEYIEPYISGGGKAAPVMTTKPLPGKGTGSEFLDSFYETAYPQIPQKS